MFKSPTIPRSTRVALAVVGLVFSAVSAGSVPARSATVAPRPSVPMSKATRFIPPFSRFNRGPVPVPAALSLAAWAGRPHSESRSNAGPYEDASNYRFTTLDYPGQPEYTLLIGINDEDKVGGYFEDSFSSGNEPVAFKAEPPYRPRNFVLENFPGSIGGAVAAITNRGNLAGIWIDPNGDTLGFIKWHGRFTSYTDPNAYVGMMFPTQSEILGLNDNGIAVGYYLDGNDRYHGFALNRNNGKFYEIAPPGSAGVDVFAAGINNKGDITGYLQSGNQEIGFLLKDGRFTAISFPNGLFTEPIGINDSDEIVGAYVDSNFAEHGFTFKKGKYASVDEPNAEGSTVLYGVNSDGDLVGQYEGAAPFVHGFLAKKRR